MENEKNTRWIFIPVILYVVITYAFAFLASWIDTLNIADHHLQSTLLIGTYLLPFFLGVVNLLVVLIFGKRLNRQTLLDCTILLKYALIPFFIIGGAFVLLLILLTLFLIPIPFMVMMGPIMALMLCILGWGIMVGTAPFSIAYLLKAHKEGVCKKGWLIAAVILQFFFVLDVISITVTSWKENRWRKLTLTVMLLIIFVFVGCLLWFLFL